MRSKPSRERLPSYYLRHWLDFWALLAFTVVGVHFLSLWDAGILSGQLVGLMSPIHGFAENIFPNVARLRTLLDGVETGNRELVLHIHSLMSFIFFPIVLVPILFWPSIFLDNRMRRHLGPQSHVMGRLKVVHPIVTIVFFVAVFVFPVGIDCKEASFVCNKAHENALFIFFIPFYYYSLCGCIIIGYQMIRRIE